MDDWDIKRLTTAETFSLMLAEIRCYDGEEDPHKTLEELKSEYLVCKDTLETLLKLELMMIWHLRRLGDDVENNLAKTVEKVYEYEYTMRKDDSFDS